MATPFTANLVVALGSPNGPRKSFYYTASDVATEYFLSPSGGSELSFSSQDVYVISFVPTLATGTIKNTGFYINGADTGRRENLYNLVGTNIVNPFTLVPLRIPGGQQLKIQQVA